MTDVTNNHTGTLAIAGVTIDAGKTVAVDPVKLKQALNSNAVKQWVKLELLVIGKGDEKPTPPAAKQATPPPATGIPGIPAAKSPERVALEAKATELGVEFEDSNKDATIEKKIAKAEKDAAK